MKYISKVNQRYLLVLRAIPNKGATWKQLHGQVKPCAKPQATMDLARHMADQGYLEAVRQKQESGQTAMCYFVTPLGRRPIEHFQHDEFDAGHQKARRACARLSRPTQSSAVPCIGWNDWLEMILRRFEL